MFIKDLSVNRIIFKFIPKKCTEELKDPSICNIRFTYRGELSMAEILALKKPHYWNNKENVKSSIFFCQTFSLSGVTLKEQNAFLKASIFLFLVIFSSCCITFES